MYLVVLVAIYYYLGLQNSRHVKVDTVQCPLANHRSTAKMVLERLVTRSVSNCGETVAKPHGASVYSAQQQFTLGVS